MSWRGWTISALISTLSCGHFSWFQMYSPASWWKGDQYLSLGERHGTRGGCDMELFENGKGDRSQFAKIQHATFTNAYKCIAGYPIYVHNGYCQYYQVKLHLFLLVNTCPPKHQLHELQQWAFPLHFLGNFAIIALLHTLQPWGKNVTLIPWWQKDIVWIPSLKLTWPLKINGWKINFLLGSPFSGAMCKSPQFTTTTNGILNHHMICMTILIILATNWSVMIVELSTNKVDLSRGPMGFLMSTKNMKTCFSLLIWFL